MYYGTFRLSYEPLDEPLMRLLKQATRIGLASQIHVAGRPPAVFRIASVSIAFKQVLDSHRRDEVTYQNFPSSVLPLPSFQAEATDYS
jgi:hypothetical protein